MTTETLIAQLSPPTPQELNEMLRNLHTKLDQLYHKLDKHEQDLEQTVRNYGRKES